MKYTVYHLSKQEEESSVRTVWPSDHMLHQQEHTTSTWKQDSQQSF